MKFVQLGSTDLVVSRICLGSWQLSPFFWGEVAGDAWQGALRRAIDLGVNFIDTADAYGNGRAETLLGESLKRDGLRERVNLASKFYWNFREEPAYYPDTRYSYVLEACEASLRRLKTDRIDLYQIHSFDPLTRPDEVAAALITLQKQGKVRWFGVSNLNPVQMDMYRRYLPIHCIQPPYSLLQRECEAQELPYALTHRMGVIPYSPLYRGLLAGAHARDRVFSDKRASDPLFSGRGFQRMLDGLEELRPIAERSGLTVAQWAVRWVLTHPAVTSAIVGAKSAEQIEALVPAGDDTLSLRDWHEGARVMGRARAEATAAPR